MMIFLAGLVWLAIVAGTLYLMKNLGLLDKFLGGKLGCCCGGLSKIAKAPCASKEESVPVQAQAAPEEPAATAPADSQTPSDGAGA
ncbi:MAG: hypothetical protein J5556_04925 [Deltaproteobacteria bacterium]|nr:hypothetical protein [Deltaproteobacteria bacterium]